MISLLFSLGAAYIFIAGYIVGFYERENYGGSTWIDWVFAIFWLPFVVYYLSSVLVKKVIGEPD